MRENILPMRNANQECNTTAMESFVFDDFLTTVAYTMSLELKQYLYDIFQECDPILFSRFQITLVLDTNILFKAVRHKALSGNQPLLEKLLDNPILRVCAPVELEKEIISKIEQKFPKDKKTREVDILEAKNIARQILERVEIIDEIDTESMEKANVELGNRDIDDIPFMGLYFSIKASGILTQDKHLTGNDSVRVWETGELGRVVTVINKGTISFAIAAGGFHIAVAIAKEIISVIWSGVIYLVDSATKLFRGGIRVIQKVPPFVSVLIALGIILFEAKTGYIRGASRKCIDKLKGIEESLWLLIQFLGEMSGKGVQGITVLMDYHQQALNEIELLKNEALVPSVE